MFFNNNILIHFQKYSADELFVDYFCVVLFQLLLSFKQQPLDISLNTLANILKCHNSDIKHGLDFLEQSDLIYHQFNLAPQHIINNKVLIHFNRKKIDTILNDSWEIGTIKNHRIGVVYVVESDNKYKIGRSVSIDKRLQTLRVSHPDLTLILTIQSNDIVQLEKALHDKFKINKIAGEWFKLTDFDIKLIKDIKHKLEDATQFNQEHTNTTNTMLTPEQRIQLQSIIEKQQQTTHIISVDDLERNCKLIDRSRHGSFEILELAPDYLLSIKLNQYAKGDFNQCSDFKYPLQVYVGLDNYELDNVKEHFFECEMTIRNGKRTSSSREVKIISGFDLEQVLKFTNTCIDDIVVFF